MIKIFPISFIFLLIICGNGYTADSTPIKICTKFDVTAYSEPKFDSQRIEKIAQGVVLHVIAAESNWYKIKTPSGADGWLAKKWVFENEEEIKEEIQRQQQKKNKEILDRKEENQKQQQKKNKEISELEAQAKKTAASEIYANINIYKKLIALSPDTLAYKQKLNLFKNEAKNMDSFRQTRWGMSLEEVSKTEVGKPIHNRDNVLVYSSTIAGKAVEVGYIFTQGLLFRAKYRLAEKHTNNNDYILDYISLKELLTKKYGKPEKDTKSWKNDLYKENSSHEGLAISMGHLFHYAEWKTEQTDIVIILSGDNFNITCEIEYTSKELKGRDNQEKEKQALEKL